MKEFAELIDIIAKTIGEMENHRKNVGDFLRESNSFTNLTKTDEILEEKIIFPINPSNLHNLTVGGVDGGMVKKSFHGIDLMLLRAVAVIFFYNDNKLSTVEYYPDAIPTPEPKTVLDPFSDIEFEVNSNIERLIKETTVAREAIEKFEPDFMLLNGSIVPHYIYVPEKSSILYENYRRMIESYNKLFDTVKQSKTILAGVIEDSRGVRFCELLSSIFLTYVHPNVPTELKIVLSRTKDSNLLTYVLKKGERSFVFPYSSDADKQPILKELNERKKIFSFYLKTAEFDRPVRVDFLADKPIETADKIASLLLACCGHESYGIPSIIIEADRRARLSEKDLEMFYLDILSRTGNIASLFEQRRNQRPFS